MPSISKLSFGCCALGLSGTWAFLTPTHPTSSPIIRAASESKKNIQAFSTDEEDFCEDLQERSALQAARNTKPFEMNQLHLCGSLMILGAVVGFPTWSAAVDVSPEVTLPSSLILVDQNKAEEDARLLEAFGSQLMQNVATDSTLKPYAPSSDGANNNSQSEQGKSSVSDIDQALQQLQKRKQVDPRTHG